MTHPPAGPSMPPPPPGPKNGPPRLYKVSELAGAWNCSDQHIYNLIAVGKLDCVDFSASGSRDNRVSESSVEAFLKKNTQKAPSRRRKAA